MRVLPVSGTWGRKPDTWHRVGSPWAEALVARGHEHLVGWWWRTPVDGVLGPDDGWAEAAQSLFHYLQAMAAVGRPVEAIVAHSHGMQVACGALRFWTGPEPVLVTVAGPVRHDRLLTYRRARVHVARWTHVYAPGWTDRIQLYGSLGSGWGWRVPPRTLPAELGVEHVPVPGASHSGLLDVGLWDRLDLWSRLRP